MVRAMSSLSCVSSNVAGLALSMIHVRRATRRFDRAARLDRWTASAVRTHTYRPLRALSPRDNAGIAWQAQRRKLLEACVDAHIVGGVVASRRELRRCGLLGRAPLRHAGTVGSASLNRACGGAGNGRPGDSPGLAPKRRRRAVGGKLHARRVACAPPRRRVRDDLRGRASVPAESPRGDQTRQGAMDELS